MPYSLSSLSLEYVRLPARRLPVPSGPPAGGDWKTASWETDATTTPPTYYARCLVGPGGTVPLAPGTYMIWLKITDAPEIPARPVAPITIT